MEDFQTKFLLALLAYAVKRDINVRLLCEKSGIDYKKLERNTNYKIQPEQMNDLWKNASIISGDALLGLHFGESMQLAALGVIGQIIQTSVTVGEALSNAGALTHLVTDMFQMKLERHKTSFSIHLIADNKKAETFPYIYRHMADYLMVFVIHELDGLLLEKISPIHVQLPYHCAEPYEYTRVFRCAQIQKGKMLSMDFPAKYLELPVLSANYDLQKFLLQKMIVLMNERHASGEWHNKVYNFLLTNSYLNSFSQGTVAANFNINLRNLQRRLRDEGVTYHQIADTVRKTLAVNYLSSDNYTAKDVAYILGYNGQSAFLRAFKRWTGKTVFEYKKG